MFSRVTARLIGDVQGVGLRWATRQEGRTLGVTGFVRNEPDGSVLIVAEGDRTELSRLLEWLEANRSQGVIRDVDLEWGNALGDYSEFEITYY